MGDKERRILENLEKAGWHLKPAVVGDLIREVEEEEDDAASNLDVRELENRVRARLLNTDLSDAGARYLDAASKSQAHLRHLPTPCVLQVAAVQDVSQSKSNQGSGSAERMLQLRLTDGHCFLKAVENRRVHTLSLDIAPGTKVTLQGSIIIHGDIILLESNSIRIEGGHVDALFDAWEIQRKYAGALSRSTTDGGSGPPPFRGLNTTTRGAQASKPGFTPAPSINLNRRTQDIREQAGVSGRPAQDVRAQTSSMSTQDARVQAGATTNVEGTNVSLSTSRLRPGSEPYKPKGRLQSEANTQSDASPVASGASQTSLLDATPEKHLNDQSEPPTVTASATPSSQSSASEPKAEGRVREKAPEVAPVQNRQAAQKLLDRRTDAGVGTERGRGRGRLFRRGGGRHDFDEQDEGMMTLDEWEAKKSIPSSSHSAAVSDEELAQRLQHQFNTEDSHDVHPKQLSTAEHIRQSMFSFTPEQSSVENSRGRGRGRGRGKGRGRR